MDEVKMKIVVASDSHGHHELLELIKNKERDKNTLFLHAGDSCAKYEDQLDGWISVKGNMDFLDSLPFYRVIEVYKHKIFITHGHLYNINTINNILKEENCDICITGHTHVPSNILKNGIYYLNPGSVARPRFMSKRQYLIIEIDECGNVKISPKFLEEIM